MLKFKAIPRKWGNSIGITLPNEVVEQGNIKTEKEVEILVIEKKVDLSKIFGSLNIKSSTQKIKDELKLGWE